MARVMAIDFGQRRVGVAVSDPLGLTATGLETISWNGEDSHYLMDRLVFLIKDKSVSTLVIGLPRRTDGGQSTLQEQAEVFGKSLGERCGIEPVFQDERYTTVIASRYLRESGVKGKKQRQVVDQVAAEVILREYLESHRLDK